MGGNTLTEPEIIKALFDKLMLAPLRALSLYHGDRLTVPVGSGVYVVYGARGKVRYVGQGNLRARIGGHLRWSFLVFKYGQDFRKRGRFRCLVAEGARQRYLLEAYATGCLCPASVGGARTQRLPYSK